MTQQPHEVVWGLTTAMVVSRTLHVIAELGVADHLHDSPVSAKALAAACAADPDALKRALTLLAAHGVFEQRDEGFVHTEASRLLRQDHPMSMRAFPRMMGMPSFLAALGHLAHSVRTGVPGFDLVNREGVFAHLQHHPEEARIFDAAMTAKAAADIGAVLGAYDFSPFSTIADIGGGRGHLLQAVLDQYPSAKGILFDLPAVIESLDIDEPRLALQPGDFFVDALPSASAYILMEVIHDWDNARAAAILSTVRRAAAPGATLLVIEAVADEGRPDPVVHTLDVIMLAITGGKERTAHQLGQLLASTSYGLERTLQTAGPLRVVEAVAV